jgi:ABC-type phosphate transport system substrate-binding protein
MKKHYQLGAIILTVFSFLPCYAHHLAVVVDKDNNTTQVSSALLARIFKSETKKWADGKTVVLVMHRNSSLEMLTLERLNKMTSAEMKAFMDAHKEAIFLADSDAALLQKVESTPGAVGLVDVRTVDGKVKVLKVDGKLPLENGYLPH